MIDTSNAGNAVSAGSQKTTRPSLKRLEPYEIGPLLIADGNGGTIAIDEATDTQFQAFVQACRLRINDDKGWSFDDRIRLINHYRQYGVDLFARANKNIPKTIPETDKNNSTVISAASPDVAQEAPLGQEEETKIG